MFDICGQLMLAALPADSTAAGNQGRSDPSGSKSHGDLGVCIHGHSVIRSDDEAPGADVVGDVELIDAGGDVVAPSPACGWRKSIRTLPWRRMRLTTGLTR